MALSDWNEASEDGSHRELPMTAWRSTYRCSPHALPPQNAKPSEDRRPIEKSSGFARLDAGALALAKAGSGAYRSTTENGQPVTSCYAFRIRFQLKE